MSSDYLKKKGREIRLRREALEITQEELAEASQIKQQNLSQYERGVLKGGDAATLQKILDALERLESTGTKGVGG